jgi:hypothetical protein
VAIVPTEYTSHVLLPRLKIFSLMSEIQNLQLALISVELARKSEPMQSWMMLVLRMVLPSQKKVVPKCLQFARSDEDNVWNELVSPMARRSAHPTSGMMEMFELKLKCMGSDTNLYKVRKWSASTNGRIKMIVCSSGR